MTSSRGPSLSGGLILTAVGTAIRRRATYEWSAGGLRVGRLDRSRSPNLVATPRDFRPTQPEIGRAVLAGRFALAGGALEVGPGGDPWDKISPSRAFAMRLHRFEWAPHLLACGDAGAREALRLFLDWRRLFYRPNRFVWSAEVTIPRLFNLACGAKRLASVASDAEAAVVFNALLHQARYLCAFDVGPASAAERFAVAAIATASLKGRAAERLTTRALAHLVKAVSATVLADGGVRSRSPQAGLELLFDLLTLDDVLLQRGRETPVAVTRAMDRLGSALHFFTLADGRLASFQGGEAVERDYLNAATGHDGEEAPPSDQMPHSGYQRLGGATLQAMADVAPPALGAWSVNACAQPLALEVVCGEDRIFANTGWSPETAGNPASRLTAGGCTAELHRRSTGRPLTGALANILGPRLIGGLRTVEVRRNESEIGVLLELAHDGWARRFGLIHERRVYLDRRTDEMRGEDAFPPAPQTRSKGSVSYTIRFHVPPGVQASLARDGRSVVLRGPSNRGWWFRNDASFVALEPSAHFEHGIARRSVQVVLKGEIKPGRVARVRWKLTPAEPPPPKAKSRSQAHQDDATRSSPAAPLPPDPTDAVPHLGAGDLQA